MSPVAALALLWGILAVASPAHAQSDPDCGSPYRTDGGYGPYDYTNPDHKKNLLPVVDRAHMRPNVLQLRHGANLVGDDLNYTLFAFPNHHIALNLMGELSLKEKSDRPLGAKLRVPCYFERAIIFKPDDAVVRMLYANFLFRRKQYDHALVQYREAEKLAPDLAGNNYNLGLYYFQMKQYDEALRYARKAYDSGYPLPGLREKLRGVGKWTTGDPPEPRP